MSTQRLLSPREIPCFESKLKLREIISRQTEKFLAKGGKVKYLAPGDTADRNLLIYGHVAISKPKNKDSRHFICDEFE